MQGPIMEIQSTLARGVIACLTLALLSPAIAGAVDFFVDSSSDVGDNLPGDGICAGGLPFARCTLRAAVEEANALPGADRVAIGERSITTYNQVLHRGAQRQVLHRDRCQTNVDTPACQVPGTELRPSP